MKQYDHHQRRYCFHFFLRKIYCTLILLGWSIIKRFDVNWIIRKKCNNAFAFIILLHILGNWKRLCESTELLMMCEETNETLLTHHLSVFFVVLAHVLILAATSRNEVLEFKANDENKTKQKDQKTNKLVFMGNKHLKRISSLSFFITFVYINAYFLKCVVLQVKIDP